MVSHNNSNTPDWKVFEKIVAQIHKTLSPQAKVTHDDKIEGHESKKRRQIDISIRQNIGPHRILIIVQCKNYKRKIDITDVGEFVSVIKDVRANMGVLVSNAGFTDGAINLAKENNINLCAIFDAQNKDWSILIKLPVICDFRKPIMRGQFKVITTKQFHRQTDPNKIEFVKDNGELISLRKLFLKDWNEGKVDINIGEHIHIPTEKNLYIRSDEGKLIPITVTFNVRVESRLFFGYVGIEKSQGIVSATDGSYTTKELTTADIDVVEVETKWQKIDSKEEAPQSPFIVLVAQDLFPLEGGVRTL